MNTHNDIALFQVGEASQDSNNRVQIRATELESQNLYTAYWVFQARWD